MKIFGIGLSKTGTTSLAQALKMLGYRTKDNPGIVKYAAGDLSSIDTSILEENDAFTDTPIPSFYRELDARYPDSKFILTVRDADEWLKSCKKQFTEKLADKQNEAHNQLFTNIYGCTVFDEQMFKSGYENFVHGVLQYFKDRPQDLLVIDVAAGEGWEELCPFLGTPMPDIPFPKANVTQIRWMNVNDVISIARQAGNEILKAYEAAQSNSAEQGEQGAKQYGLVRSILEKARYAVCGGTARTQQTATKVAHKIILKRLKELNPRIPVISRMSNTVPYSERSRWNHFWLVDPLDGEEGLLSPGASFTVNIALIEDRKPISGVIFAPALDTIYYAMVGKGAFRIEHGGVPQKIEPCKKRDSKPPLPADRTQLSSAPASKALAMCLVTKGEYEINPYFADTMEWQTAGAHAVINFANMMLVSHGTGEELTYNKEQFRNDSAIII